MKNNATELVFILDRSGSMAGLEGDTIGGFNAMLEKQKRQDGPCWVTTVLFDNESRTLHDRVPLSEVPPMTERDYTVGGCTALLDAIGGAVRHIEDIHRYVRPEDVPEHTVFVITTDGMENASKTFGSDQVKRLIEQKREQGWEFLFVAANIDAVETAAKFGIEKSRAVNFRADRRGTMVLYDTVCGAVSSLRRDAPLAESWSDAIREDFENR